MNNELRSQNAEQIPVWNLVAENSTELSQVADSMPNVSMSPERLDHLRKLLTSFSDSPVATLEMHKLEAPTDAGAGVPLSSTSPLAKALAELVANTPEARKLIKVGSSAPRSAAKGSEVLYRMVVPAELSGKLKTGALRSMSAKGAKDAIHSQIVGGGRIAGNASFVPVSGARATVTGASAVGATGALTVAAPLVLFAVAAAATAQAEKKHDEALAKIEQLFTEFKEEKLKNEIVKLKSVSRSLRMASAALLDRVDPGKSLGLDNASGKLSDIVVEIEQRLEDWERSLNELRQENVDVKKLEALYPGILTGQGSFLIQLEIAKSAISLNRKLLVVQAVEHAQSQFEANALTNFIDQLRRDEGEINRLEARIQDLFRDISQLKLVPEKRPLRKIGYSQSDLKEFANQTLKLKSLADVPFQELPTDEMVIEIEQHGDGSLVVFTPLTTPLSESELSWAADKLGV
ncbi:hypothetical protein [Corynebacterium dentalis]|uniref:hypothetical protein n=1 Tax=Corynebacterium dentalis TaxID=2014528 RepID=UPI0028A1A38C|nr:hypothetical protein [Corynebacterium dentalis]